jgi:TrmH family RNA methyltransferase
MASAMICAILRVNCPDEFAKLQIKIQPNLFASLPSQEPAMIPPSKMKLIRSLGTGKYRDRHKLFLVEGHKMVWEALNGPSLQPYQVEELIATPGWIGQYGDLLKEKGTKVTQATGEEIRKVSNLVTPQPVIALLHIPEIPLDPEGLRSDLVIGLESVRDPGNLGTIIRTAEWFGIRRILCTPDTVDLYNPKVVQATMGSLLRVRVHYVDLVSLLRDPVMAGKAVYGTFLSGRSIYEKPLEPAPLVLFGNEANGLTEKWNPFLKARISIPSYADETSATESLNVASAVAVVCSELRRASRSPDSLR